jgi:alpha-1,2-mannosyltransferase
MMAMIVSPGMFHASAAYLPSSFAMYTTMLGMAAFMNWKGGLKTAQGIFWFAVGGVLGWPFSIALSAPFLFEEVVLAIISSKEAFIDAIMRFLRGTVAGLLVLVGDHSCSISFGTALTANSYLNFRSQLSFIEKL